MPPGRAPALVSLTSGLIGRRQGNLRSWRPKVLTLATGTVPPHSLTDRLHGVYWVTKSVKYDPMTSSS